MSERYDIAIVGSGPAGLSASINAKIRNKNIIIFGSKDLSNKVTKAPKINNYLGLPNITGEQLKESFVKHIQAMDIDITVERINNIYAMGEYFALMANEKTYEATSVILATGVEFTRPLPGELEYLGRGVGYCATCDAPLYKGKVVTVIGYNKESVEETNFISELVGKVYFIPMYKGEYKLNPSIEIIKAVPKEIKGTDKVDRLILNNSEISTDAIFILKDSISPGQLVPGLEMEEMHIKVNRKMETNLPGLYACGDITGKPYQYIKAAGEGLVSALNAVSFIDNKVNKELSDCKL
ncbi:NAD(P)/FAD-dependent oxidoreductase [Clostridium magnum]|uniref:Thioredoxin reductase n=1 Tax=Clostridium magnum DSM 2767 TaxID=1121326 RepID=A0A161WZR3_9CLOT|nr:NAD(P)/FAD-dependent oxidoreductase [Clostridium magnum]KZL92658.1 thioredoxin reductase [Clostridium magnum DSM 2767]SHI24251.1 thioredoxin reductase (NADPH) [Clostridium magnum DSM 2767]